MELVQILYDAALESVNQARQYLRQGDIPGRTKEVSRSCAILLELTMSVRQDVDPTLGRNLIELYDYMQRRVLDAHIQQADAPLAEVGQLLVTLQEGWTQCRAQLGRAETAAPAVEPPAAPVAPVARVTRVTSAFDEPVLHESQVWTA
jgi:flagellar protein FliS